MLDCLLLFFLALWVVVDLVFDGGGGEEGDIGSPPPPPPPPPPAAKAGTTGGAAISTIEKIAIVTKLVATLITRASRFPVLAIPPAAPCKPRFAQNIPEEISLRENGRFDAAAGANQAAAGANQRAENGRAVSDRAITNGLMVRPRPARVVAGRGVLP